MGINFFLYILGVTHYRSSAIKMLGLHHFQIFNKYLTIEHKNIITTTNGNITNNKDNCQINESTFKLLRVTTSHDGYSTSSLYQNNRLSEQF